MELPPEFCMKTYLEANVDLCEMSATQALDHYKNFGRSEGRVCNAISSRTSFLSLVPGQQPILEIGPFCTPGFRKPQHNVHYLDAFSADELRIKSAQLPWADPDKVPFIDYVWRGEPYGALINERFSAIYSSHNVEHQPDLIWHFQQLAAVLKERGRVFLVIPDKRFCFDHYLPESTYADIVDAYLASVRVHTARSQIEHRLFTTHNETVAHWSGDNGLHPNITRNVKDTANILQQVMAEISANQEYTDSHAWQFTPTTFKEVMKVLSAAGLVPFALERIYETTFNNNEFYVVLRLDRIGELSSI